MHMHVIHISFEDKDSEIRSDIVVLWKAFLH